MANLTLSLIICSFLFSFSSCYDENYEKILLDLISSLKKIVDFYKSNYRNLNLDGVFGLRIIEGQLLVLLSEKKHGRHLHLRDDIWKQLNSLQSDASQVCQVAIPFVQKDDEYYFIKLKSLILEEWKFSFPHRRLDLSLIWPTGVRKNGIDGIREAESDRCMHELLHSGNLGNSSSRCVISERCLRMMSERGHTEYSVTHQLLYVLLAIKIKCVDRVDRWLKHHGFNAGVEALIEEFCVNNYADMVRMERLAEHTFPSIMQDLFMEQQYVCPTFGYLEFLSLPWMEKIMSWQKRSGCYGDDEQTNAIPTLQNVHLTSQKTVTSKDQARTKRNVVIDKKAFPNTRLPNSRDAKTHQLIKSSNGIRDSGVRKYKGKHDMAGKTKTITKSMHNHQHKNVENKRLKRSSLQIPSDMSLKMTRSRRANKRPNKIHINRFTGRKLLKEKILADGCLAHKTAVAGGALAIYLKFLIDPGPRDMRNISLLKSPALQQQFDALQRRAHPDMELNPVTFKKKRMSTVTMPTVEIVKRSNVAAAGDDTDVQEDEDEDEDAAEDENAAEDEKDDETDDGEEEDEDDDNGEEKGGEMNDGKDEIYDQYDANNNMLDFKVDPQSLVDLKEHPIHMIKKADEPHNGDDDNNNDNENNNYADDYNYYVKPDDKKMQMDSEIDIKFKDPLSRISQKKLKSAPFSGYSHAILISIGVFVLYLTYKLARKRRIKIRYPTRYSV